MQVIDKMSALKLLCNLSNKWGMYIACTCPEEDIENMCAAAPYLSWEDDQHIQVISNGEGYLLFDTEEEMEKCYNATVGDDGPTKTNPYSGSTRVYALTCGPDGKFQTENT
jgi:hypothetical protein